MFLIADIFRRLSVERRPSAIPESSVDHKVRVVLGVPVYKDHKVIGVLGGSCNVTALSHMLLMIF